MNWSLVSGQWVDGYTARLTVTVAAVAFGLPLNDLVAAERSEPAIGLDLAYNRGVQWLRAQ